MQERDGRIRVIVEHVSPALDGGRFPVRRIVGDDVFVEANIFADGHDVLSSRLLYRVGEERWQESSLQPIGNDRWRGSFKVDQVGEYRFTITAWVNHFQSWHRDLIKRWEAGQVQAVDLAVGANLLEAAAISLPATEAIRIRQFASRMRLGYDDSLVQELLEDRAMLNLMETYPHRALSTIHDREYVVIVDRPQAGCSAWYELFPRSCADEPGVHGSLRDVIQRLPYVAALGFDVLYLPPIHPIGTTFRKGRNNTTEATSMDVGSPWGIGSEAGGHKSIHPRLGTFADFDLLVKAARQHRIEIALDVAFQCSPDHPYVREHPSWFRQRPDGTIQYAENPPKKYQDIYPFDFETGDWQALWVELKSIFEFWIDRGIRIFRVDNPHTKPMAFWEWCLRDLRQRYPDTIFLSEAFTRPKIMYYLAKAGFTQSYTYFAWRNHKQEITDYLTELTQSEVREYFRPNFWPNTPDILTAFLQTGGHAGFIARFVLAATLSSNYGIYGPAFELEWSVPFAPGSEEYLNSEKYEAYHHPWDLHRPLPQLMARVNQARKTFKALQRNDTLRFHEVDNDALICYSKLLPDRSEIVIMVVNLDPHHRQCGNVILPLDEWGLESDASYEMHDVISGHHFRWTGPSNLVVLDPEVTAAHVFVLGRL